MAYDPNDPEDVKILKKAVDDALAEATDGLNKKNKELLDELKAAKKGRSIDPAEVDRLESKIEETQAKLAAAEKQARDAAKAFEKAQKDLETESAFTQRLLIQDGLKSALIANGVKDEDFIDSLTAKFAGGATVKIEGEERKALYGDKPLGDFIKEWAGSDAGKKFVEAPANSGGNAPGGGGKQEGKTMLRSAYDALAPSEQHNFVTKEGGKVVDAAA